MQPHLARDPAVGPGILPRRSHPPGSPVVSGSSAAGAGWIVAFVVVQFACQFALLTKELAPARVVFRIAAFGVSLLFLVIVPGRPRVRHAARLCAALVMVVLTLSAFNPSGGTLLAVTAHWAMYLAVLAPLFWVARLDLSSKVLGKLLLVYWTFHSVSAAVGMLQVYFPGQFQPALTTFIAENQMLSIRLASGEYVPRPMGLTDIPGGAAASGVHAALIGIGVILTRPFRGARVAGFASMTIGMACLYLSQIRAALVMLGICFIVLICLLALAGKMSRSASAVLVAAAVVTAGFYLAFDRGGDTVTTRLSSLVQTDPGTVYRTNRGFMLEYALSVLLPEYPLGAGLGRWGMMNIYFGSRDNQIWAEVQWVGWLLDGGVPLILAYAAAVGLTIFYAMRASLLGSDGDRASWAAVIAAYDVGVLALCFSYVSFMGAGGLEFWLLNAVLIQSSRSATSASPVALSARPLRAAFAPSRPGSFRSDSRS